MKSFDMTISMTSSVAPSQGAISFSTCYSMESRTFITFFAFELKGIKS